MLEEHEKLISKKNKPRKRSNGIFRPWRNPVVTAAHTPVFWRYDLDLERNPFLMERLGINATFNAGAMLHDDKYLLMVRVEGNDRKSFFAIAESPGGVDNFRFWKYPVRLPETGDPDTNVYDMQLTAHEDGWIYGLFCTERRDMSRPDDTTAAVAQCGIARTRDLVEWERLPDLDTHSDQQRNVVLHPEFIDGKYGLYTRPRDAFISVGSGGGIGWGLTGSMENARVEDEQVIDRKAHHTIKEVKYGQGPPPIRTERGWLHLAHGVCNTAAGLQYVLYMFMTDLNEPWKVTYAPGGHFLAPQGMERVGDISNVVFSTGWIANAEGKVFVYYGSSDTRIHVATSTIARLVDYVVHTPPDSLRSAAGVAQRCAMIDSNLDFLNEEGLSEYAVNT